MLPLWPSYFLEARALVFVIDAAAPGALAQASLELWEALAHPHIQVYMCGACA
jgi:hypothetical protein